MPKICADPFDIEGKAFIVAGAGGGLASAIVLALAERGAKLMLFDIDAERLAAAAIAAPGAETMLADITDEAAMTAVAKAAQAAFGRVDGGVNAAGLLPIARALEMDMEIFRRCQEVNVTGALLFSRALAAVMKPGGGRIVHIASVSSYVANPGYAAYAPSKGALLQLIRVLAREWAADGITINGIGPALTETPLTEEYLADPGFRKNAIGVIPMGRLGEPEDIVATTLLLLAPGGAFVTGQVICVDGGRTLV